ncbi:MAG: GAF domain-containing protein [Chloroflexia bacterium]
MADREDDKQEPEPKVPRTPGLQHRYRTVRRRADALYELSVLITSTLEIGPLVELLLTQTRQVFGADRAAVFLRLPSGEVRCADAVGLSPHLLSTVARFYDQSAVGRAGEGRRAVYVADLQHDASLPELRQVAVEDGIRSIVAAPFRHQGRSLGALALYHDRPRDYDEETLDALTTFANQVAVALTNARLFEEAAKQVRHANFLADAGRLLNSSLEMGHVLDALSLSTIEVLGEGCAIYMLHNNADELTPTAYADALEGSRQERMAFLQAHLPRIGETGIGMAALHGEVMLIDADHPAGTEAPDPYRQAFGAHSYLAVPLLAQHHLIGVLVVWLFNPAIAFAPEDILLTRALADHAAVALENARLYEQELEAQQAKDAFLSAAAHELRTPLTAILGYVQLIRRVSAKEPNKFSRQMDVIWSQAQRLNRLVETILDMSNIEQGRLSLSLERLDLWSAVDGALEHLRASARPDLSFDLRPGAAPCWVTGDRVRLEQVFSHLIANAIKYSPLNGTISIEMDNQESRAVLLISDNGPGMSADQLNQLFQRYYQGDTPHNRTGGLGLGLHISRAVIEAHGGTLSGGSTPGGAVFKVTLPAEAPG